MRYTWRKMPEYQFEPGEPDEAIWCVVYYPDDDAEVPLIMPGPENCNLTEDAAKQMVENLISRSEKL
jgi:hypothetical protein